MGTAWRARLERARGIEPRPSAWKADILPLNHARLRTLHSRTDLGKMIAPRFVGTDHRGRSCPNSPEQWGDPDLAQKYLWKGCYGPHRVVSRRHAKEGGHRGDRPQTLYARSGEGGEAQRRRYVGVTFPDTHRSAHKAGSQAGS